MNELGMIKAFAELEDIKVELVDPDFDSMFYATIGENKQIEEYNPLLPNSLNCAARDKYRVEISYHTQFDCGPDGSGSYDIPYATASTEKHHSNTPLNNVSSEAICFVVIECILKSEGLWK